MRLTVTIEILVRYRAVRVVPFPICTHCQRGNKRLIPLIICIQIKHRKLINQGSDWTNKSSFGNRYFSRIQMHTGNCRLDTSTRISSLSVLELPPPLLLLLCQHIKNRRSYMATIKRRCGQREGKYGGRYWKFE